MSDITWLAHYEEEGGVLFRVGRSGGRLVAEWPGTATLVAAADGSESELRQAEGSNAVSFEKIRAGGARGLVESLRGNLALHASAAARGGRAVLVLGPSGAGKSSTVADLCANGADLLADDVAVLAPGAAQIDVLPTEGLHWLDRGAQAALIGKSGAVEIESTSDKTPCTPRAVAMGPARLVALLTLEFAPGPPLLEPISGLDVWAQLVPAVVRFAVDDAARQQVELDLLMDLVSRVRCWKLRRPREFHGLRKTGELVERLLQ